MKIQKNKILSINNLFLLIPFYLLLTSFTVANASDLQYYTNHMDYLTQRDMVLSKNIANADTPKYLPKDLKEKPNPDNKFVLDLDVTNPRHINILKIIEPYKIVNGDILELKPDGNGVTIEHELMLKNENSLKLQEIANLYNKSKSMMKYAITGQGK